MITSGETTTAGELTPLGTEEEFAAHVARFVATQAPDIFALVYEHGERADGWVMAWGFVFGGRVHLVDAAGCTHTGFTSVESARLRFSMYGRVRVVWVDATRGAADPAQLTRDPTGHGVHPARAKSAGLGDTRV